MSGRDRSRNRLEIPTKEIDRLGVAFGGMIRAHHGEGVVVQEFQGFARQITYLFMAGQLDLSSRPNAAEISWDSLPEVAMAAKLRASGATDIDVRLYLTFTSALDRARDATSLWTKSAQLFNEARWSFSPKDVAGRPFADLREILQKYGVSQRHGPDSRGWRRIALTLTDPTLVPHVRGAIYEGTGDTKTLLHELSSQKNGEPLLPFLRGPKIGPMWVRMLAYPGEGAITSLDELPVAVDVQVRKLTEYLAVTNTIGQPLEKIRADIQAKWAEDVRMGGAEGPAALRNTCAALDPALWFYAKWGCSWCEKRGTKSPISPVCDSCRFDTLWTTRRGV
jgi:hypothetical protein